MGQHVQEDAKCLGALDFGLWVFG